MGRKSTREHHQSAWRRYRELGRNTLDAAPGAAEMIAHFLSRLFRRPQPTLFARALAIHVLNATNAGELR